jgi:hypothetical protein
MSATMASRPAWRYPSFCHIPTFLEQHVPLWMLHLPQSHFEEERPYFSVAP